MALEASEYMMVRADQLHQSLQSSPGFRAVERAGTVLALGALGWVAFKMYDASSDITLAADEAMRGVEGYISPLEVEVNQAALTDDALNIMRKKWGAESRYNLTVNTYRFNEIRKKLTGGEGSLKTYDIQFMKGVESHLVKVGYISREETTGELHPLDKAARWVLHSKAYPALILGVALLPAVPVLGGIIKETVRSDV